MNVYKQIEAILKLSLGCLILFSLTACPDPDPDPMGATHLEFTIQGSQKNQIIHGFGASDAWSCQFIGKNWPEEKRNQMADWLFSLEKDELKNPQGIGLNTWRFNIGAGSAFQAGNSDISDAWRRAESFMISEDEFDINQQEGQRWFLNAAKNRGVKTFIGFVNSPPVPLTKNGKAYSSSASSYNLPATNYEAYGHFLADVYEGLSSKDGIVLDYISPFNEPQWDWNSGGQEGSPATNSEIANISRIIDAVFTDRSISAKLEIPESGQFEYLYKDHNKPGRGNQIDAFFNKDENTYVGDLPNLASKVAGHSYYTTWPLEEFINIRESLAYAVEQNHDPIELWMTEYCVLENNDEIKGNGRDLGMNAALYAARVIFADLVVAQANSWQWWLAISPYDYKDGLVYVDYDKFDGNVQDSKTLWALGHFSRFISSGMHRYSVSRNDFRLVEQTLEGVMASAYLNNDHSKMTAVIINYSTQSVPIKISFSDLSTIEDLDLYLTDGSLGKNLSYEGSFDIDSTYEIPARSIITITNVQ